MGRIDAALSGRLDELKTQVTEAVEELLRASGAQAVDSLVVTGNTTMLYLLTGKVPDSLARAPFEADTLFGTTVELFGVRPYLPPCINAFVGADITCTVLSSGMYESIDETEALDGDDLLFSNGTALQPRDIRAVQLAKAAIAAGILTLIETSDATYSDISTRYIAGGFGSHLNVASATAIGLIPQALANRVQVLGNAALFGAAQTLLD